MRLVGNRSAWALVSLSSITISCLNAILLPYIEILAVIMGSPGKSAHCRHVDRT